CGRSNLSSAFFTQIGADFGTRRFTQKDRARFSENQRIHRRKSAGTFAGSFTQISTSRHCGRSNLSSTFFTQIGADFGTRRFTQKDRTRFSENQRIHQRIHQRKSAGTFAGSFTRISTSCHCGRSNLSSTFFTQIGADFGTRRFTQKDRARFSENQRIHQRKSARTFAGSFTQISTSRHCGRSASAKASAAREAKQSQFCFFSCRFAYKLSPGTSAKITETSI
ncbi:MAG: hypothetical protein JST26_07230, partial [Bacteroidetes bacterium]|nr:hypothetical protein [Bacteroidota bacterium]